MSWMGLTSQVTNYDWFIHETSKGVSIGRECLGHWSGKQSNLSLDILAGLGKGWRMCGNPYLGTGMVVHPDFHVGIVVHLCRVWKLEVLQDRTGCSFFYTHGSVVDDMAYLWWSLMSLSWTLMLMFNYESWTCHSLNEPCIFVQMYKCLLIPFASTRYLCVEIKSCEYAMYSRCCR